MPSENFNLPGDENLTPIEAIMMMITPSEHLHMAVATFGTFTMRDVGDNTLPMWREQVVNDLMKIMKATGNSVLCTELIQLCAIAVCLLVNSGEVNAVEEDGSQTTHETPNNWLRSIADEYPGEGMLHNFAERVKAIQNEGQIATLNKLFELPSAEEPDNA